MKTTTMEYKATGHYTISKVFHEAMGYSYAQEHGMGVVCCRIGNFSRTRDQPTHPHELGFRDCGEVFIQAVVADLDPIVGPDGRTTHQVRRSMHQDCLLNPRNFVSYPFFTHFSPFFAHFQRLDARNPENTARSPGENGKKSRKIG